MAAKPVNYTTQQLIDYIVAGGNISDLVGSNVTQSGLLSKLLADPRLLSALGQQISTAGGGTFDPTQTYTTDAAPYEAMNNSVRLKYSQRSPVEQQIASYIFDAIDQGTDPMTAVTKMTDENLKQFGVTQADVAGLIADLSTDASKYVDAKATQNAALQKQQYNAFLKQTGGTGTGAGALATRLGIPSLANLSDPSQTYAINRESLLSDRFGQQKYVPTSMDKAMATKISATAMDPSQGDPTTNQINRFFGSGGEQTRAYVPESILGNKQLGTRAVNEIIGTGLAGLTKLAGGFFTAGGYNPFSKGKPQSEINVGNTAAQQKAYQEALKNTTGALNLNLKNQSEQRIATKAAQIINERMAKLAEAGVTPFTQQARGLVPMLTQTKTKIKKK
jgi:hypothetical protein